ncbi:MAG: methyltransferase regulatory domain-containing protein [Hyphomicrobiales bacterium]
MKKKLKVGGALQISYNCYPGWAAMVPLQHLMNLHKKTTADKALDPRVALQNAFGFVNALANANAGFFKANPGVKEQLDGLGQQDATYLVHELFHDKWPVTPFSDVADKLGEAKMSFVGSANLLEHIDVLAMSPQHIQIVNSIADLTLRESVRDFCMNRRFRSDIFTKGAQAVTREERDEELRKMKFVLVRHPETLNYEKIEIAPGQTLNLKKKFMDPVVKALSENNFAPKTVAEIEKHDSAKGLDFEQLADVLITLTGCFVIAPAQEGSVVSSSEETCKALNSEFTIQIKRNNVTNAIASPLIGGGFGITSTQLLFLSAALNGKKSKKDTIAHSWALMQKIGWRALENGEQIKDEKVNIERLEEEYKFFSEKRMPLLKAHHII